MSAAKEVPISGGSVKQKVLEAIEKLPADATLEDAIERFQLDLYGRGRESGAAPLHGHIEERL